MRKNAKSEKNEGKDPNVQVCDDDDDTMNKTKQTLVVSFCLLSFEKVKRKHYDIGVYVFLVYIQGGNRGRTRESKRSNQILHRTTRKTSQNYGTRY